MFESEPFDSEEETLEELYDGEDDAEGEVEDDEVDAEQEDRLLVNGDAPDDATEDGEDDSASDDSDEDEEEEEAKEDEEEEDDDDDDEPSLDLGLVDEGVPPNSSEHGSTHSMDSRDPTSSPPPQAPTPRKRSLSPAQIRRNNLAYPLYNLPRSYIVEAVSAIVHPVPIHSLAASSCMSHLLTGADDGYIRDYDLFASLNGKNLLTQPQRHHAGVVDALMKTHHLRFWWENTALPESKTPGLLAIDEEPGLAPVYSLTMHPDALWALSGTDGGYINLFTVRHDPGRLIHVMQGHRGPVSGLALDYDYKGLFSACWDGEAIQWDLNTGQNVRNFIAHNSQLTSIGLRPQASYFQPTGPAIHTHSSQQSNPSDSSAMAVDQPPLLTMDDLDKKPLLSFDEAMDVSHTPQPSAGDPVNNTISTANDNTDSSQNMAVDNTDARSDASFDPLFDDVPEEEESTASAAAAETKFAIPGSSQVPLPTQQQQQQQRQQRQKQQAQTVSSIPPPKGAPPLFDSKSYNAFSPDILMTAYIDGQVILWDRRVQTAGQGIGRLWMSEKTPPWCLSACWSWDGSQIYAGRRNETVDVWDVRVLGQSGPLNTPRLLKTLRNPTSSGVVSCVVSFPDCRHIASASVDNIRLWNVAETADDGWGKKSSAQFKIIPGHHGGFISQMLVDSGCRFLISASSNRGWYGDSTRTVFVHDIKRVN